MSELRHKSCGGKVEKIPEKFLSEKLKKKELIYMCFGECFMPIKPTEVEEKDEKTK